MGLTDWHLILPLLDFGASGGIRTHNLRLLEPAPLSNWATDAKAVSYFDLYNQRFKV